MDHLAPISDDLKAGAELLVVVGEPLQQRHVLLQLHLHPCLLVSVEGLVFLLLGVEEENLLLPARMILQRHLDAVFEVNKRY